MADSPNAQVVAFPDLKPGVKRTILGTESGTQFDSRNRLFSYSGDDVLDYGTFTAKDYDSMLIRDGQAAAIESVLTLPIRQAPRAIEPAEGDKGEADFVRSVLLTPATGGGMETPIQDVIGQLTSAQTYKKAHFEKVFSVRPSDNRIIYSKIAFRPASTCEQKRDARTGAPDGFRQSVAMLGANPSLKQTVPGYVEIPELRSFVYVHGKHRQPLTGTSELELSLWCWRTKMKLVWLWLSFLESQALPKVIVYGQSPEEANDRADDIASMRSSGIVGFQREGDNLKAFDVLESAGGKGAAQYQEALTFLETWQTTSVLAGFMGLSSLASLGRGSLALSQDQSAFFLKSRQAVTAEMEEALTHDVIAPLVTLNFGTSASYPRFRFGALTDESGAALVGLFQTMATAASLQVPPGILDVITERTAAYLNLPEGAVHQIVEAGAAARGAQAVATAPDGMPAKAAEGVGRLAGGVAAAHKAVSDALKQASDAAQPEDVAQPFSPSPSGR